MEIEVKIHGLMLDPATNMPIVVLKSADDRILPIWVGICEANAIALEIEKVQTPRPMTHDTLKNVFLGLNAPVEKVVITEIKEATYYALIWANRDGQMIAIDSRPSDAIALALRADCPIFVEEEVFKAAGAASAKAQSALPSDEEIKKWLEGLDPGKMGRA